MKKKGRSGIASWGYEYDFCCVAGLFLSVDSGGIQKETPALGKPVLVMRNTTERPEGIEAGTLKLVGTEEEIIYSAFTQLLDDQTAYDAMAHAANPYGDGFASVRIANILQGLPLEHGIKWRSCCLSLQ